MTANRSVCAVVPAAHRAVANAVLGLVDPGYATSLIVPLSTDPDLLHPGFGAAPPTHYLFNDEGATDEIIDKWFAMRDGDVEEVLPEVAWGEEGNPELVDAIAAMAAMSYFQRVSEDITPLQHVTAVVFSSEGMGAMKIYEEA
jgi:hypothetical protein